jgi:hypothetical protein
MVSLLLALLMLAGSPKPAGVVGPLPGDVVGPVGASASSLDVVGPVGF